AVSSKIQYRSPASSRRGISLIHSEIWVHPWHSKTTTAGAAGPRSDGYSATIVCGQLIAGYALKDLKAWSEGGNK
ncbi:MAG: hypothetical protein IJJ22_03000, partial [Oscillospiraceae bacterium]|nr:hypothetical protein [Oscillospiraceae bacterium]